jgi:hypothetical protein
MRGCGYTLTMLCATGRLRDQLRHSLAQKERFRLRGPWQFNRAYPSMVASRLKLSKYACQAAAGQMSAHG